MAVDPFITPTPDQWRKDPQINDWVFKLLLVLDQLLRPEGAIDASETTTAIVLTQQQKLDLITITQAVNLDSVEAAIDLIATSSPAYTITNDATDRTLNANAAVSGTGIDVANAGPANVALLSDHDALVAVVQEQADVIATLVKDLAAKDVLGT